MDEKGWLEVAREHDSEQLNGNMLTGTFAVAGGGQYRFIRLVNISRDDPFLIITGRSSGASPSKRMIHLVSPSLSTCAGDRRAPLTVGSPGHTWAPSPPRGASVARLASRLPGLGDCARVKAIFA
jgi:hypothetical protein